MEKFDFYLTTYQNTILYSIPYLLSCSLIGIFIILKRTSLLGFALTEITHVSFILSVYLISLWNQEIFHILNEVHLPESFSILLTLDIFFWGILFINFFFIFWMSSYAQEKITNLETFWAILIAVFAALIHLLNKLADFGDHIGYHSYFTELLYTPRHWFSYYLPHLSVFVLLFILFLKPIFLVSFDQDQAHILQLKKRRYEFFFFILATGVIALSSRLLGVYLTVIALLLPGYLALGFRIPLLYTILTTLMISLVFILTGFTSIFYFDQMPSEPVFIVTSFIISLFIIKLTYKTKKYRKNQKNSYG